MLTVPLRAHGVDETGQEFTCTAKTISVNRHGARIQLDRRLGPGTRLRLTNLARGADSEFRVVAYLGAGAEGVAEWGVETRDPDSDFWGIYFPYPSETTPGSSALAQCQRCQTVALLKVSEVEADVLETGARIAAHCEKCGVEAPWTSAEKILPKVSAVTPPQAPVPPKIEERRHPRHYVQRPLTIRDSSGGVEKTQTENVSRSGLCCTSGRLYEAGQTVTLSWQHSSTDGVYEVQARVARRHDIGGSVRKIYGFDFLSSPILRAAPVRTPAGLSYLFGALIAAAAALAGTAVFRLAGNFGYASQNWLPAAELTAALPLLYFASRIHASVARGDSKRHGMAGPNRRPAGLLAALALTAAILSGAVVGIHRLSRRTKEQRLLADIVFARSLEQRLDAEEIRSPASSIGYADSCATLRLLARQWKPALARLHDDLHWLARDPRGNDALRDRLQNLAQLAEIEQEKLRLITSQVALAAAAAQLPASQQLSFWQANFNSLQSEYQQLNVRRDAEVASLTRRR